jgi:hypothetical protein
LLFSRSGLVQGLKRLREESVAPSTESRMGFARLS